MLSNLYANEAPGIYSILTCAGPCPSSPFPFSLVIGWELELRGLRRGREIGSPGPENVSSNLGESAFWGWFVLQLLCRATSEAFSMEHDSKKKKPILRDLGESGLLSPYFVTVGVQSRPWALVLFSFPFPGSQAQGKGTVETSSQR